MPIYDAKSIPAEVNSGTKDPEVAAFLKTGPVLGAHKPIHGVHVSVHYRPSWRSCHAFPTLVIAVRSLNCRSPFASRAPD